MIKVIGEKNLKLLKLKLLMELIIKNEKHMPHTPTINHPSLHPSSHHLYPDLDHKEPL